MSPNIENSKDVLKLDVYRDTERAGTLERTKAGARFRYDPNYLSASRDNARQAIAFAMPLRERPYEVRGTNLHPFFAGLLPEGLRLSALVRGLKTSEDDLFSLLVAAGGNTVGDVWVSQNGRESRVEFPAVLPDDLDQISFEELFAKSLNLNKGGDPGTIAGVQPKVSSAMISMALGSRSKRSEYILKLPPPDYPRLIENEFFFMRMAKAMRLPVAEVKTVHDRTGASGLLVLRFDRVPRQKNRNEPLTRLHQEDACQLLDRYPADKYRLSLREIAGTLDICSAPLVERNRLVQLYALSYLIANGDLHAKNISVQCVDGRVRLTPIYDLLSTLPYGDGAMALKMDGRDQKLTRKGFVAFGERIGVKRRATEGMLDRLVKGVGPWVARLGEIGFGDRKTQQLKKTMNERLGELGG